MLSPRALLLARLAQSGPFGFGASSLGNLYREISDVEARATVDGAWDLGVRYFDTAPFYGCGLSERRLGDALRKYERDSFLLSTKVGRRLQPGNAVLGKNGFHSDMPFEPVFDYSYDGVMRSFEASLHRLGLARIDILLLHDLGVATHGADHARHLRDALDGGFRALTQLRDEGVVSAIGLGVNETAICEESLDQVDLDILMIAGRYTLLDQQAEELYDRCHQRGIGILAAGIFNSGILATGTAGETPYYDYVPAPAVILQRVAAIERVCEQFGVPLPVAAFNFALSHPAVALALIGTGNAQELRQAVALGSYVIPGNLWTALAEENLIVLQNA